MGSGITATESLETGATCGGQGVVGREDKGKGEDTDNEKAIRRGATEAQTEGRDRDRDRKEYKNTRIQEYKWKKRLTKGRCGYGW